MCVSLYGHSLRVCASLVCCLRISFFVFFSPLSRVFYLYFDLATTTINNSIPIQCVHNNAQEITNLALIRCCAATLFVVYFFLFYFINVLPSSRWKFLFRFFFNYLRNAIKIFVVSKVFVSVKKADFNQWKRFLGAKLSGFLCVKRVYGMYVCVIWAELATIQPIGCSTCVKTNENILHLFQWFWLHLKINFIFFSVWQSERI